MNKFQNSHGCRNPVAIMEPANVDIKIIYIHIPNIQDKCEYS